jgi:hypothetical protein
MNPAEKRAVLQLTVERCRQAGKPPRGTQTGEWPPSVRRPTSKASGCVD